MASEPPISLKEYLRLSQRRQKNPVIIDDYDDFILKVWTFFDLRATAEDNYRSHLHLAKSSRGALPLDWPQIKQRLEDSGPPVNIVTQIAKLRHGDVDHLIHNLRKVLSRVRQKESLGRVQQIDSHCLRWLTCQPGRSPVEKAGFRQEILAVTRVENFDTLENRVFKDFLIRASAAALFYLRKYGGRYPDHAITKSVVKFNNLCSAGLALPVMDNIRSLYELPQPNYVLQQDARYSKVWRDYCRLIRQEELAEKLWAKREECLADYDNCLAKLPLHCSPFAKYRTQIWFNELDGKRPILDKPWWDNELGATEIEETLPPKRKVAIVDLTNPWDERTELVYGRHDNAKPFIQSNRRPNNEQPTKDSLPLQEIVRRGRLKGEDKWLRDYFEQLHGLIGGDEWVVLVPDTWEPQWLERVKRCCPLPRGRVFLIWRSIAAVLGCFELWRDCNDGDSIVVVDGDSVPNFIATRLVFKKDEESGRVLPQRASYRLHTCDRFATGTFGRHQNAIECISKGSMGIVCCGILKESNFPLSDSVRYVEPDVLIRGVERYLAEREDGIVSYFDELDAFTLIRTNRAEEIEKAVLIEHEECWPGGHPYKTEKPIYAGTLAAGESKMSLFMFEGVPEASDRLKTFEQEFEDKTSEAEEITMDAELTPGQGLATITVHAAFLESDVELALHDKTKFLDSEMTISRIERELKRHFPPNMPYVEACDEMWDVVRPYVRDFMEDGELPPADLFARAQPYWGRVDPTGKSSHRRFGEDRFFDEARQSPIDKLKRENVFGNAPGHRYPRTAGIAWDGLFTNLAASYCQSPKKYLRLIAWSYQFDSPCFEFMREELYDRYVNKKESLSTMEITFCSNNFDAKDERVSSLTREVLTRIGHSGYSQEELRLAYNLMQFYPLALSNIPTEVCNSAMIRLMSDYQKEYESSWFRSGYWAGGDATKAAGYHLKCMLFLLHRRRTDAEFFKQTKDWCPDGALNQPLPVTTATLQLHEGTRKAFIQYVRGQGTVDGIPMGD